MVPLLQCTQVLWCLALLTAGATAANVQVDVDVVGTAAAPDDFLGLLYARRLLGYQSLPQGDEPCAVNASHDFWQETWRRDPTLIAEWAAELGVGSALDHSDGGDAPAVHPPPHHPHHHPQHPRHESMGAEEESGEPPCCEVDGYGELTREAADEVAAALGISASSPTAVFADLGSGAGKLVLHWALQGYASRSLGVERNPARHQVAVELATDVLEHSGVSWNASEVSAPAAGAPRPTVTLLQGDMMDFNLSEVTVVFLNQACFPSGLGEKLADKLLTESLNLEAVVASPSLPSLTSTGQFEQEAFFELPMQLYSYGTPLTVYRRRRPSILPTSV